MMSGMPPETYSAFNKFWNNKFYYWIASCWLFLLLHTTMHGSMNTKSAVLILSVSSHRSSTTIHHYRRPVMAAVSSVAYPFKAEAQPALFKGPVRTAL